MTDNRTMDVMLQAPTEGYGDTIMVPDILAENFEIKTGLLSLIQANQFHSFESNNPHDHIKSFNRITSTLKFRNVPNKAIKLMWKSLEKDPPRYARIDKLTNTISNLVKTFNKKMTTTATVKAVEETCVIYEGVKVVKIVAKSDLDNDSSIRPNGEALRKCILSGPYKPTTVLVLAVEATNNSLAVPEHTTVETLSNMSPEKKAHFLAVKEAIHLILTGIGDDIYLTVDACQTAQEMWEAIKRLQQGQHSISSTTSARMVKNDDHSGQFGTWRTVNVVAARENVGRLRVPQGEDVEQAEQGVPLQAKQYDWLADTDEEVDEQELEAHYSYMAKIQEVLTADSCTDSEPVKHVQNEAGYNVFANLLQHSEQSEYVSNTCLVETDDSNVIPDSPDMCEDDIQNEQNDVEGDDERVALANLKLDVDENKKIQKQLKKANTTLDQELKECKAILAETSKSLRESISVRDSFLVALQTKQAEFEKFKAFNDCTVDYYKLERKLNEALGQLAHKDTVIREGLKTKAYELSVVKEKHDELMKRSLLTKSHYEGIVKQKTKVIMDLKLREEHDIEKMLSMEKQLKFLNEIV
nr:reverse transcriptase domain-containing protein [Tanacetum cinerariifolium]